MIPRIRSPSQKNVCQAAQQKYQKSCKDTKIKHWQEYLSQVSSKVIFMAVGYTNGQPAPRTLPPFKREDSLLTSNPKEEANLPFEATGGPTIPYELSDVTRLPGDTGWTPIFIPKHIADVIDKLKMDKAPGSDGITNLNIEKASEELTIALATLLNLGVSTCTYPTTWKSAATIILKKPGKTNYTNTTAYQPIDLLRCPSKLIEAKIESHMQNTEEEHNILPKGYY